MEKRILCTVVQPPNSRKWIKSVNSAISRMYIMRFRMYQKIKKLILCTAVQTPSRCKWIKSVNSAIRDTAHRLSNSKILVSVTNVYNYRTVFVLHL